MKTHYIGLALIALLFFNCDSGSNSSDDDFLNGRNYVSENNLFITYLTSEIEEVQIEIDSLQMVIDEMSGDAVTVLNLNAAIAERDNLESTRDRAFLIGNPVALETSESCPEILTCITAEALYFVTPNASFDFDILILNDQSDIISDTSGMPINDLPGVNDFKYQEINMTT